MERKEVEWEMNNGRARLGEYVREVGLVDMKYEGMNSVMGGGR